MQKKSNPSVSASTKVVVKPINVTSVVVENAEITLSVGETLTLNPTALPEGSSQMFLFSSSNPSVASVVQSTGVITAKAAGETIITIYSNDPYTMEQPPYTTVKVTVIQPVTSITLPSETITITEGETVSFAYTVNPENASNKALTWKVSGATPEKLTVTDGQISANGFNPYMSNEYTVTATSVSNPEVKATMKVVVEQAPLVESVSVNAETITMKVGETFDTSRLTVAPAGASNKTSFRFQAYVYGSWDNTYGYGTPVSGNVITESNGTFTANTPGTYTIGVSMDGLYSVQPPFTSFTLVIEE